MFCGVVLKLAHKSQALLLDRQKQKVFKDNLESCLTYRPFVFNYTNGIYIFFDKEEPFEKIQNSLLVFFCQYKLSQIKIYDTMLHPNFFWCIMQQTLTSNEASALEWKHFISSFLIQIDPYNLSSFPNNISVFEKFQNYIISAGTKQQYKYFKRRLKMLRKRVSLEIIEELLKND